MDYDTAIGSVAASGSTADEVIQNDNKARLGALLEVLNPNQKACLVLREIEGLSYREISAALKIPVNTVRTRLKRARQALLEGAGRRAVKDVV